MGARWASSTFGGSPLSGSCSRGSVIFLLGLPARDHFLSGWTSAKEFYITKNLKRNIISNPQSDRKPCATYTLWFSMEFDR